MTEGGDLFFVGWVGGLELERKLASHWLDLTTGLRLAPFGWRPYGYVTVFEEWWESPRRQVAEEARG